MILNDEAPMKYLDSEKTILSALDEMKWQESFCCSKCQHDEYIPGKSPFSRRCKSCKYDESLFKHTAFEGLRIPINKAYGLLEFLYGRLRADSSKKIFPIETLNEFVKEKEIVYMSMGELLDYYTSKKYSGDRLEKKLRQHIDKLTVISVSELAEKFEIEENTVMKLMTKVGDRIMLDTTCGQANDYLRVCDFIRYHLGGNFSSLLSMLMKPLIGDWNYGITNIGKQWLALIEISEHRNQSEWDIYPVTFTRRPGQEDFKPDGRPNQIKYDCEFDKNSYFRYGTDRWKNFARVTNEYKEWKKVNSTENKSE